MWLASPLINPNLAKNQLAMNMLINQKITKMNATPVSKNKIKAGVITAAEAKAFKTRMWNLYSNYYNVDQAAFFARFDSNDFYAIYKKGEELVGFTGLRLRTFDLDGEEVMTFYLGQTVMRSDCRGKSLLPRTCSLLFAQHFLKNPTMPIYVWCDSLTFKPYLLFSNSLKKCYPTRLEATPKNIQTLINKLGHHYYKNNFDPATGTVYKENNIIEDPSSTITEADRQNNPDIDFFANANPGHSKGHGLITIAPINFTNFLFLVKKCIKKQLQSIRP